MTNSITDHQELSAHGLQRRAVLKGVTLGALAAHFGALLPRTVRAADGVVGSRCMTVLYQNGPGVTFDFDYYRDKHLTLIMDLYGNAIKRFELRKPVTAAGTPPPAYAAAVNFWVNDLAAFEAAGAKHSQTLINDVPNFTNTQPIIQNDEVWGEAGGKLTDSPVGTRCLTILYPNSEGARWDADYYRAQHMTLIMDLYGTEAIRRFEVRKGLSGMDGVAKPAFIGCVNIYIADQAKFDAAGAKHGQALRDDVPNFSSVNPSAVMTEIYGVSNT
jgi:uncharacterized protein (TIGR02118 family)